MVCRNCSVHPDKLEFVLVLNGELGMGNGKWMWKSYGFLFIEIPCSFERFPLNQTNPEDLLLHSPFPISHSER